MAQVEAGMQRTTYSLKGKFGVGKYDDDDLMMMRFLDVIDVSQ